VRRSDGPRNARGDTDRRAFDRQCWLARAKWMDRNTYMLRMNVQRALGIRWSSKDE
jgi:hypothetical protein